MKSTIQPASPALDDLRPSTADALPAHLTKPLLRRREAVEYLELAHGVAVAHGTLARLASVGGGPEFVKAMRKALYRPASLDRWAAGRITAGGRS